MAAKRRARRAKAATPTTKQLDVQLKEFHSAMEQLNDAMVRLEKIQLCVECSCGPCNECAVCRICRICRVCRICKVCNVCYECSCGPCAAA